MLNQIVTGLPLDIMPGPNDPSNISLAQQDLICLSLGHQLKTPLDLVQILIVLSLIISGDFQALTIIEFFGTLFERMATSKEDQEQYLSVLDHPYWYIPAGKFAEAFSLYR
ncbi:hypothetical protein RIF29_26417 [Crotalaria pallida]|uniref:Uncharacterized protein n=1 Tax=Crotalaria pallida TaxID=3830 RepID=A0AAN9EMN7_CROPI